jgi:hypothetical protein
MFTLDHLVESEIVTKTKIMILVALITYGDLISKQIGDHVLCLKANNVYTFQGVKFGLTTLMKT